MIRNGASRIIICSQRNGREFFVIQIMIVWMEVAVVIIEAIGVVEAIL